ncbi:MAG TPA: lysophospholipid acyltransferase family protein [Bacteroidales bacterium]|nr:lysophospholipid acyltransferase family protein [Bacteroidales bacterium]
MEKGYFQSFSYQTPVKKKRTFIDRLRSDSRLYFTIKYAIIVLKSRKLAIKKEYGDKEWADSSFVVFRLIEKAGGRFNISGMENILKHEGPVLFISNHMSTLETMIFPCIVSPLRRVTFVVKESLVKHPLFKDVMQSRDPVVVGRSDPRKDLEAVMNGGADLLSKGISIIIFPQSTRSLEFMPEEFNSIGVKLAKKAGVPVVPIAIKTDYWGNGKYIKELGPIDRKKTIYMKFGGPFMITGNGKEENNRIIKFIQDSLKEWKD